MGIFAKLCVILLLSCLNIVRTSNTSNTNWKTSHNNASSPRNRRALYYNSLKKWPNGEIPYIIDEKSYDMRDKNTLLEAFQSWHEETCIRFRPRNSNDESWVEIVGGRGCYYQNTGMSKSKGQKLILGSFECAFLGVYMHELGHVIGLLHEQTRADRDDYIKINSNNIDPLMKSQFTKKYNGSTNTANTPYDYQSIMHYGPTDFAIDDKIKVISPVNKSYEKAIYSTQTKDLSFWDVRTVNKLYECSRNCSTDKKCQYPNYLDQYCKCQSTESFIKRRCVNELDDETCEENAKYGDCINNKRNMSINCRKTCNFCFQTSISKAGPKVTFQCKDTADYCADAAKLGGCSKDEEKMKLNCRCTCKFCTQE